MAGWEIAILGGVNAATGVATIGPIWPDTAEAPSTALDRWRAVSGQSELKISTRSAFKAFIRLRAERANHVWSSDFAHRRTHQGRAFRTFNVMDRFTHESLAIRVRRKPSSTDVIDVLTDPFILHGPIQWSQDWCERRHRR